jgi:hypothetical protein
MPSRARRLLDLEFWGGYPENRGVAQIGEVSFRFHFSNPNGSIDSPDAQTLPLRREGAKPDILLR